MEFYGRSYRDLKEYLGYLLETPTEGLLADELRAEMTRLAANPDLTERTAKVLSVCETARYARHPAELNGAAARELADDMRAIFQVQPDVMAFQHLEWLFVAVPVLVLLLVWRFWRRHYWGHSLVAHFGEEIGGAHPIVRAAATARGCGHRVPPGRAARPGVSVHPDARGTGRAADHVRGRSLAEHGGAASARRRRLRPLPPRRRSPWPRPGAPRAAGSPRCSGTPGSRMEAVKRSALDFVSKRPGDAIGLVVFSNNGYLVSPATFDHESMTQYMLMTGTQTLVNEGYTAIGEGLATANPLLRAAERDGRAADQGTGDRALHRRREQLGPRADTSSSSARARTASGSI